jgi:hypothetical protein
LTRWSTRTLTFIWYFHSHKIDCSFYFNLLMFSF